MRARRCAPGERLTATRAARAAGGDPVRAQRRRVRARRLPRARRRGRGPPGVRGRTSCASSSSTTRSSGISAVDPVTGQVLRPHGPAGALPGQALRHARAAACDAALGGIRAELRERLAVLPSARASCSRPSGCSSAPSTTSRCWPAIGFCPGRRELLAPPRGPRAGRAAGLPARLLPEDRTPDFLLVIDESHVTVPQIGAMYEGDRSRKQTLVDFGFRLPSALDNRPLRFAEFEAAGRADDLRLGDAGRLRAASSARAWWSSRSSGRPGWSTPRSWSGRSRTRSTTCSGRSASGSRGSERVLVTTLTKRMAEDLTDYLTEMGVRVRYLHSDIDALERVEILRGLRLGEFDVLVGINLLREGLDLPEVSLVAILDADKEGFLRCERSLIQTAGRAARNVERPGHPLRRQGHRLDAARARRDRPPPRRSSSPTTTSTASRRARSSRASRRCMQATAVADAIRERGGGPVRPRSPRRAGTTRRR